MRAGIYREVLTTDGNTTLFRSNTGATKLVGAFTLLVGQPVLRTLLRPFVDELRTDSARAAAVEVDPSRLAPVRGALVACTRADRVCFRAPTSAPALRRCAR